MMTQIQVEVLFFGAAAETAQNSSCRFSFAENTSAQKAFDEILTRFPALRERFGKSLLFAVNQEYADTSQIIENGDELAVFPPVSGG